MRCAATDISGHTPHIVEQLAAFVEREGVGALACAEMEGASFRSRRVTYPDALARVTRLKSHTFFAAQSLGGIMQQGNSVHAIAPIVAQTAHRLPGSRVGRVLGEVQLPSARSR